MGDPCCFEMLSRGERASATAVGASDLPPRIKMRDGITGIPPTYPPQLTLKAPKHKHRRVRVPLNLDFMTCHAQRSVPRVHVWALYIPCPKEERGCCKNQCSSEWALGWNPPLGSKEQLIVNGWVRQSNTVSPSVSRGLSTEWKAWWGGVRLIIFHEWWTVKCNKSPHYCKRDLEPTEQ